MDSLSGRKLVRQQEAPGTSATDDVEDGVEDLAQGETPAPPGGSWSRQMRLYALPLGVGEVGWVSLFHACWSSELLPNTPFSDSLRRGLLGNSEGRSYYTPALCYQVMRAAISLAVL